MKIIFGLLFTLLVIQAIMAEPATTSANLDEQEKLKQIKNEIKASKEKIKETKVKQQEVLGKIVEINRELKQAAKKLTKATTRVRENEGKIGQLTVELRETEKDLKKKASLIERRVMEAYKNGRVNYFDLLFASSSMSDFLSRLYYFEKIVGQNADLIRGAKNDLKTAKVKKESLREKTKEIKELAVVIAEQKKVAAQQAIEKKKALNQLKEREKLFVERLAELEKSSVELEAMIQRKMAERSKTGMVSQGTGTMIWPLQGRITLRYGARHRLQGRHTGIDIATPYGTPILAADGGEVIFAGWWDGYGKAIVIDHGKGIATVYAHLSRIYPAVGNPVAKGQTIGLEGSTGYSTGPHLHFEVRKNGRPVNPIKYLPRR
ncbi:MAG: peptidoglycan DD-metalloendopeptidase family protein [bacterium]